MHDKSITAALMWSCLNFKKEKTIPADYPKGIYTKKRTISYRNNTMKYKTIK